ncbi:hypothetical protein C8J25_101711 [Sphingomonas faeni]|uniref:Uncharacterized protein n=1 Tax=Sphingomonas faeni TaxID=185950 RepID=A0A2T5UCF0_9SPHN|nr:hypothetical protein [Sphingomonas faeni]PTW49205.1 hypothetical protein C8J25_101711 [Sphingomonas faeni]
MNRNYDTQRQGVALPMHSKWRIDTGKGLIAPEIEELRRNTLQAYMQFGRVPADRLMWLTIISAAIVVTPGNHASHLASAVRETEEKIIARCRRRLPGLRIRGVHEVDLLTPSSHMGTHKVKMLKSLGVDAAFGRDAGNIGHDDDRDSQHQSSTRILLPHFHAVVDRREHSAARVADEFRSAFPGSWRTLAKSLYSHQTVTFNLSNLAGYSTKMKVAYNDSMGDRNTKFFNLYEPEWRDSIIATLQTFGTQRLLYQYGRS